MTRDARDHTHEVRQVALSDGGEDLVPPMGPNVAALPVRDAYETGFRSGGPNFWRAKRLFDISLALALAPFVLLTLLLVFAVNPFLNRGPVLFWQSRMGRWGRPFKAVKIRTMRQGAGAVRGPDDPLEEDLIPAFGKLLRKTRIDELPQIWNVLRGEMSLIGPRPDMLEHALDYIETVPGYAKRLDVRPGISGYAQVRMGYAEGREATRRKAILDLVYVRNASWRMEGLIFLLTLKIIVNGFGAK